MLYPISHSVEIFDTFVHLGLTGGMRKINKGFTLIELLITLVIAAILVTIAVPNFSGLIQNNRLITQTNNLIADLNYARSESIKRGVPITISPSDGNWANGWKVALDDADEDDFLRIASASQQGLTIKTESADPIVFAASGSATSDSPSNFTVCDARGNDYGRVISIAVTGRVAIEHAEANCA
ncbi:MAG: pilus assembly protein [Gammaproteobacteria bacterium]|nr:MAG: pilus assembly protein [Gammaproteobacteria bacterium]